VLISLVTLVEHQRLVVKAACGVDVTDMPRDDAFCTYTILGDEVLVIPDMWADKRFRHNAWVTDEPHARFYAGAPLIYRENLRPGSLCVLDTQPRPFSGGNNAELREMADRVVTAMATQELTALMRATRIRWCDDANGRCSSSSRQGQPSASSQCTPRTTTPSICNATSSLAGLSAS